MKRLSRRMNQFRNKHAGERCAILANGESVAAFPDSWKWNLRPTQLQREPVIGLNHSWELVDAPYHCIIDVKQLKWAVEANVKFKYLFVGIGDDEEKEREKRELLKEIDALAVFTLYGQQKRYGLGFCTDLAHDTFYIPSVPYMALQIAAWMGFKEMHFWGLDLHGAKFWDSEWEIPKSTAQLQDRQFKYANRKLKALGVRVVNHSKGTHCTAFERA